MCLDTVIRGKEKKAFLATLPDEIVVWKVVVLTNTGYETDCRYVPLHSGEMKFKQNVIHIRFCSLYRGGGHFWLHKKDAEGWRDIGGFDDRVVKCRIKKEWINTIGLQCGIMVLVVKKAVFPKYIGKGE